jgi:hypothetical protein
MRLKEWLMSDPWMVLAGVLVIGVAFVLAPVMMEVYLRFRGSRRVGCPEAEVPADVALDAPHAALTAAVGTASLRLTRCSLWPARSNCAQNCLEEVRAEAAESIVPPRT